MFFGCREPLHNFFLKFSRANKKKNHLIELTSHFVVGALLGATISSFTFPLNVLKTRIQSNLGGPFESPVRAFGQLFAERNKHWKEVYRGVHLNFTRSMLTWGITNCVFELFKRLLFNE